MNNLHGDQWLESLKSKLPEKGRGEIIIIGDGDSTHVPIDRGDIERMIRRQKRHAAMRGWLYKGVAVVACAGLVAFTLGTFDKYIHQVVESAKYQALAEERQAAVEALDLYSQFTADIVAEHAQSLETQVDALGTDMQTVEESIDSILGTGGMISARSASADVLNQHVPQTSLESLQRIRSIEEFMAKLPARVPMAASHMTSGFGMREHPVSGHLLPHRGIDLVSWDEPAILAGGPGRVTFAEADGSSGKMVIIDHGAGVESYYLHMARIDVEVGDTVAAGDVIGLMGDTGQTDGGHLHYEVRVAGRHLDPAKVLEVIGDVE